MENLEGDIPIFGGIIGFVYGGHPASADLLNRAVASQGADRDVVQPRASLCKNGKPSIPVLGHEPVEGTSPIETFGLKWRPMRASTPSMVIVCRLVIMKTYTALAIALTSRSSLEPFR